MKGEKVANSKAAPSPGQNPPAEGENVAAELSAEQENVAWPLLARGATFEAVVLTFLGRGQKVRREAVETYFFAHPELSGERARHMMKAAREIRKASADGDPEDIELADAVIATGLLGLRREQAKLDVNDAIRRDLERQVLTLKKQLALYKASHERAATRRIQAETRALDARFKKARKELEAVESKLTRNEREKQVNRDVVEKIREIYGLIKKPIVPAIGEPQTETQQAR